MLAGVDRVLAWVTWLAAALVVAALFVGPQLLAAEKDVDAAPTPTAEEADPGEAVFGSSCASCHTLAAAGASGAVGPNLDEREPDAATVTAIVTSGAGSMPSFEGRLSAEEIDAVAQYVATNAGG